jgi:ribosomal protein L32
VEYLRVPSREWHRACGNYIRRGHATQYTIRDIDDNRREGGSREKPKSPKITRSGRVSKPGLYPGQQILSHPFT